MSNGRSKIAYVVAPSGQAGGGMGRVKDYILQAGGDRSGQVTFLPLVTRDNRGFLVSIGLLVQALVRIARAQLVGDLALVHVNMGDKASSLRKGVIAVATRLMGGRAVVHLHAVRLLQDWTAGGALRRWMIALPFRMATTNIVLGEVWRRWLIDDLGVAPERVDVLANGVPAPPYRRRDHDAPKEEIRLLFLGNLLKRKGVDDLIEAAALLPPDLPPWRLTFAGGGDLESYMNTAAALGLAERIRFIGWVGQDEAGALLAESDGLVLPSYDEGLPLVILEALGAGTPVICTPIGAIPEFLIDGGTALFVPAGDVAKLASALKQVILEPALRQRLGDEGRASYEANFSLQAFQRSLFEIYRRRLGLALEPSTELLA